MWGEGMLEVDRDSRMGELTTFTVTDARMPGMSAEELVSFKEMLSAEIPKHTAPLSIDWIAAPYYTTTNCATSSCALAAMKNLTAITSPQRPAYANQVPTIILDGDAATPYSPQSRVMHEMGHIADFLAGPSAGS